MARFTKRPITLSARPITEAGMHDTHMGPIYALPGDWLVTDPESGEQYPIKDLDFRRLYLPADQEALELMGLTADEGRS